MKFTIIVPAFNEEACLGPTLDSIQAASELLRARRGGDSDVIVVDNNSTDGDLRSCPEQGCDGGSRPRVRPSCRRFDIWPLWRILIWTNPLFIVLFRRWKPVWRGWYSDPVR